MSYIWVMPPSTKSSTALTKELSSEARNTTALAISSVVPKRPRGIVADLRFHKPLHLFLAQTETVVAGRGHHAGTDGR